MSDSALAAGEALASRVPATLQFSHPQEFLAELHRDRAWVHRGIVRLTRLYRPVESDPCQELSVLAGYLVATEGGTWQLVEVRRVCGPIWSLGHDGDTEQLAERTIAELEQAIADLHLECRPGRLIPASSRTTD